MVQKRYVWLIKLLHLFHICLRFREAIIPSLQGISFIATWTSAPRLPQTEVAPFSSSQSKQDGHDDDPDDEPDDDPHYDYDGPPHPDCHRLDWLHFHRHTQIMMTTITMMTMIVTLMMMTPMMTSMMTMMTSAPRLPQTEVPPFSSLCSNLFQINQEKVK